MKQVVLNILIIIVSLNLCAQDVLIQKPVRFLALGDSYTIGQGVSEEDRWPNQLAEALAERGIVIEELKIIARTGWRTDNLLEAIENEQPEANYNLVSLLIGVNNQYQGIDFARYPNEFRELLDKALALCAENASGVFVLSIPDYGYTPFGSANQNVISAEIDRYNQVNKNITNELGIAYFDITPISREAINKPEYLATDNLHPSAVMYAQWVELIINGMDLDLTQAENSRQVTEKKERIYPNPARYLVTLDAPGGTGSIVFYNTLGAEVYAADFQSQDEFQIDVSKWETGIYYYRMQISGNNFIVGKLLVK